MGWLFSNTRTPVSNNSRELHRTECPDDENVRDQIVHKLTRIGHHVTGYLSGDNNYQPMPEPAPTRQRRGR